MNDLERNYFNVLIQQRLKGAEALDLPFMEGFEPSVTDKYSDQAHFIYELLQNADDAKAIHASFKLLPDRLVYSHNGKRHFFITDPETERYDKEHGQLGDINAITSVGRSNKTKAEIGKFGMGFKSVFVYTKTPHIYDPNFMFRIERFFVPYLLDNDYPERKEGETLFVFPFDNPKMSSSDAYSDIAYKLKSLSYPLLFLSELNLIEFEIGNIIGLYGKTIKERRIFDETIGEHVCLTQNSGNDIYDENLWMFSRIDKDGRKYSVGFFLDENGRLLPTNKTAFCFFPTKETTNLNFIIHGPFLLTDSREGILAGNCHNTTLVQQLADLAADSLNYLRIIGDEKDCRLIDDTILNFLPINEDIFPPISDRSKISFRPFFRSLKDALSHGLLPTENGYTDKEHAYWSDTVDINKLFSDDQLSQLLEAKASWVFKSYGRNTTGHNAREGLQDYIDDLTKDWINEADIFRNISGKFISQQSEEWLHLFYAWLKAAPNRFTRIKSRPIFLDAKRNPVPAFDSKGQPVLFLPTDGADGYETILPSLLDNPDTAEFIRQIGIKEPSLRDKIYNRILPKYKSGETTSDDTDADFVLLFNYYLKCPQEEIDTYISLIKDYRFIKFTTGEAGSGYDSASNLYLPTSELVSFLEYKKNARFAALEQYMQLVGASRKKELESFLSDLGIMRELQIVTVPVGCDDDIRTALKLPRSTRGYQWSESCIDGCKELLQHIIKSKDPSKSVLLWNTLVEIAESKCTSWAHFSSLLRGKCEFFYYSSGSVPFESSNARMLKNEGWMVNKDGDFVKPGTLTQDDLSEQYNTSSPSAKELFDFLGIKMSEAVTDVEDPHLSESQRAKIRFANEFAAMGIDISDVSVIEAFQKWRESTAEPPIPDVEEPTVVPLEHPAEHANVQDPISQFGKRKQKTIREIMRRVTPDDPAPDAPALAPIPETDERDSDDLLPRTVDFSKKIEQAMQKNAAEISRITQLEELQNRAASSKRYTFGWFNALLELEALNSGEENAGSREVSISFSKVELAEGSQRTLILKHPSRYIPQFMEELADIPLVLHMGDTTKTLAIEVASIKSYTLHVKLKSHADIRGIDFSKVQLATIDAKSPVFLTEALKNGFAELGKTDDFDMQANLCSNIEFVFGPPGTGKTTYLAREVLIPLMELPSQSKVLVLTPTNKSADVLVKKIMDAHGADKSYEKWLVRFGGTADEAIEQSPVFRDKTFDIRSLAKSVTVTTIARFPYDFFMPPGQRIMLSGMNWDYIVIDEASMIPIANIVYPLYKKTPKKFIIAGDPFQIEPIASVDTWKDENIYKMVCLNSFKEPKTIPHQYEVKLLTTQYRSVPEIGKVFSKFAYDGVLEHYRKSDSQRPLNAGDDLGIETLNIIKYPVSKYESIYRAKKLQHSSSYQVYSALFTYEYLCYFTKVIAANNRGSRFTIGVIAPYRAQASLIDKLLASEDFPKEIDIQVGTIHGFQGDECDIIFAVLNTPPSISSNAEMFLNRRNIINVSISRARDYLFIIMPDDNTENIGNLTLVKKVEALIKETDVWQEFETHDLEDIMFDDPNYLENNAFSTGHQNVNVYGLPEKCYEIRSEDNAVDIQVHKSIKPNGRVVVSSHNSENDPGSALEPSVKNVPEKLRQNTLSVNISGAVTGKALIVPYSGKLIEHTTKPVKSMFIPIARGGKEKILPVSVCEEEHVIYIAMPSYTSYASDLQKLPVVKLKK